VLTVDIVGAGVVVVVCTLLLWVSGVAQPAKEAAPANSAAPIIRRKHDLLSIIVWFLFVQALGPGVISNAAGQPDPRE
jgi:hypothetical protein